LAAPRSAEGTPVNVLEGARVPRRLSSPQNGETVGAYRPQLPLANAGADTARNVIKLRVNT